MLITADGGYRRGNIVPLKKIADEALTETPSIEHVIVVRRGFGDIPAHMQQGRDHWYHDLMADAPYACPAEPMDAEDMLYTLYTSGTTGKPKGIVHTTGGYLVGTYATTKWVFDLKDEDVYWCTADIGWVTGHSYVVYGPLTNGATRCDVRGRAGLAAERSVLVDHRAPRRDRFLHRADGDPRVHAVGHGVARQARSVDRCGCSGRSVSRSIPKRGSGITSISARENCPVVDTWWQTETGAILITPLPGHHGDETRIGDAAVSRHPRGGSHREGEKVTVGGGLLALTRPWPSMLRGIYGDPERYVTQYWSRWSNDVYFTGDGAKRDEDGYFWLLGRVDDVMNVAGHRIGTMEVESALVDHPKVAEAAVVGTQPRDQGSGDLSVCDRQGRCDPV